MELKLNNNINKPVYGTEDVWSFYSRKFAFLKNNRLSFICKDIDRTILLLVASEGEADKEQTD